MEKLIKICSFLISVMLHVLFISGAVIVLLWLVWDITPQKSITKTAYFFSQSTNHISNKITGGDDSIVREEQLKPSSNNIKYLRGK